MKNNPEIASERNYTLDFLRILSMFMVVLIHVIGTTFFDNVNVTSSRWFRLNLLESGIRWCVPVFVMISGALFLDPRKELSVQVIWSKYIRHIATAFLFWSVIYAGMDLVRYPRELDLLHQCLDFLICVLLKPADHLWFVYMIVGLYMITPILRKVVAASSRQELQYWLAVMFLFGLAGD